MGYKLISIEDKELTLNVVKNPKRTRITTETESPILSKALFSMLNKKELFLEWPILFCNGCFSLYCLIWMVRIMLRRTEPEWNLKKITSYKITLQVINVGTILNSLVM